MTFRPDLGFREAGRDLDAVDFFDAALRPPGQATTLPPAAFRSLSFLKLEDEAIWTRLWVCIGIDAQIPHAGDLLPFTVGEHGIHVQRKRDGGLIGRFNQAQHGGCRVVPLQCQGGTKTPCSFTSCGHSRDRTAMPADELGRQSAVMHQFLGLRPERLLKVPTAAWASLIFVNLDETPAPFDPASLPPPLAPSVARSLQAPARWQRWLEFDANWKLVGQALTDGAPSPDATQRWLRTRSNVGGRPVDIHWLFPNLVLMRTDAEIAVVILQPTAIGRTLCRASVHPVVTAPDDDAAAGEVRDEPAAIDWASSLAARGRQAELTQRRLPGAAASGDPGEGGAMPQRDAVGDWMQRTLARAVLSRPRRHGDLPLFDNRRA